MTPYERAVTQARRRLLRLEEDTAGTLARVYADVLTVLAGNLEALTAHIQDTRTAGEALRPAWLYRQDRYRVLIDQLEGMLSTFAGTATRAISTGQADAAQHAATDAVDLTVLAMGPGPEDGEQEVRARMPVLASSPALDAFAGRSADGTPLGLLLLELVPDGGQRIRGVLAYSVAVGLGPREVAREVAKTADITLARALTISRTEILTAYRAATHHAYEQSTIIGEWQWYAAINERTCPVCLAMHGTKHPLTEPLASHPACRCTALPVTPSWEQLGYAGMPDQRPRIETGEEAFARLTRAEKEAIVGPERLALLDAGKTTLPGLVRRTTSRRWGPGRRVATLTELNA